MDEEVIEIVNISKTVPLRRLIFEIEHESSDRTLWRIEDFNEYLEHYHRLETPSKDKLVTRLIMAGKYDSSYIYVVSAEVLSILKEVFRQTQKFA